MFAPKPIPQNPLPTYPPPPAQPPTDVTRTPVPEGAPPPGQAPDPPDRVAQVKARIEPRKEKARAALKDQRAVVRARLKAWFAAADLTDDDLAKLVLGRKQKAHRDKTNQLSGEVTRLRRKLSDARVRAAQERISTGATQAGGPMGQFAPREASPDVVHLDSEVEFALLNLAEHRKTFADILPASPEEISRARQGKKASRPVLVAAGVVVGGMVWVSMVAAHPVMALIATPFGLWIGWRWLARPIEAREQEAKPALSLVKQEAPASGEAPPPFAASAATVRAFDAPPPPALTVDELTTALREIIMRPAEQIKVLAAPERDEDGNTSTVFDLPPRVTVAMLQQKIDQLAGALGRDITMIDVQKVGASGRASLWMSDADPFEAPRPSPLLMHKGGIDAWKDGVPVAWGKRGNIVALPVNNSHFVIAGMTRSGKGVGAANLTAGASLDVRINLRIVAGKTNGEFDPYARSGVAATYFKQRPARLLALVRALLADMNRRNAILGELGKSKLTPQSIERLGGIELLVIDELATFTRPESHPDRDELLGALEELASVATGAGIFLVLITQYPEADIIPQGLAMNCGTRWAMRVDNAQQSNAILGGGSAGGSGRDASKFDPPRPGLGWLVNPFAGVTDLARSFDLDEDDRGEVTRLLERARDLRNAAGRLAGQWEDPIEQHLMGATGLSSVSGGPKRDGVPGRNTLNHRPEQRMQMGACRGCLKAMDHLERDVAQLDEMVELIGGGMDEERLGELLRAAGAGGTVKISVPHKAGRVNGYRRTDIAEALDLLEGN